MSRVLKRLTILDSPEQILKVKPGLVLAEWFVCRDFHYSPENT